MADAFDAREDLALPSRGATFRVYTSRRATNGPATKPAIPLVLLLHGAGQSAVSFFSLAARLRGLVHVAALDLRGHGASTAEDDADLSIGTLAGDVVAVLDAVAPRFATPPRPPPLTAMPPPAPGVAPDNAAAPPGSPVPVVLVGHSMGGAVATHAVATHAAALHARCRDASAAWRPAGLVVIDVVEGTAVPSLPAIAAMLSQRPASFASPDDAVEWAVSAGVPRNRSAAQISVPPQLVRVPPGSAAPGSAAAAGTAAGPPGRAPAAVGARAAAEAKTPRWAWRTDLLASRHHWRGWYEGMSALFLRAGGAACPKVLVLAGVDRLDRALTVGQMQGLFQMSVLRGCGHAVHEDAPEQLLGVLVTFLRRRGLA
jgi:protein phosphatase methylesterase 1